MNSRRLIASPEAQDRSVVGLNLAYFKRPDVSSSTGVEQPAMSAWVKSGHVQRKRACPLYPRKRHQMRRMGMSALGQKETCAAHKLMSALSPKADMCSATRDVCFGPIADMRLRTFAVETMVPQAVSVAASMTYINLIASVESQITTSLVADTMSTTAFDGAFNNHATADAFAAQFSGTLILPK